MCINKFKFKWLIFSIVSIIISLNVPFYSNGLVVYCRDMKEKDSCDLKIFAKQVHKNATEQVRIFIYLFTCFSWFQVVLFYFLN